ncbi:unnamed protein product [Durusdinium trenchii]|uniref:Uncharacterized protein n=1 Tax=Durusdinium trenchii TaxID=1381693 RepID=A0ABP0MF99_9DINO
MARLRSRFPRALLVLTALFACRSWNLTSFVSSCLAARPGRLEVTSQLLERRASAAAPSESTPKPKNASDDKEIDDAVLRMAMAMTEEEGGASPAAKTDAKEEGGFDFNILVTVFWVSLIVYSFGSSIIGVTQGRIQDRTGGDFTLYDFFDNIFAFSEWNWEYSLGFDPFKLFDGLKSGGPAS